MEDQLAVLNLPRPPPLHVLPAVDSQGQRRLRSMTSVFVPDGVLLDLALPGLPGEVALERFGGLDATVPVIIISDNHDEAVARASLAKGAFE